MIIPVIAVFLTIAARSLAEEKAEIQQLEELMSDSILDEIADNDESTEVSAAVRYMIPVPIRVVIPVPQPQPVRQPPPYPDRDRYPPPYPQRERDPIVAVPIGLTPGRYGRRPSWRPIGPPVIAVPIGSATRYPLPNRDDDDDFERRALSSPQRVRGEATVRRTRSLSKEGQELTSGVSLEQVPVIHRAENPLKVSTKPGGTGFKSSFEKRYRSKRQLDTYAIQRTGYVRPSPVLVPVPAQQQPVVITTTSAPKTQVVPVGVPFYISEREYLAA